MREKGNIVSTRVDSYRGAYTPSRGSGLMRLPLRWILPLAAAAILLITTGGRQTIGLFVAPLDQATGFGIVSISLAIAIGQFTWGFSQPFFGALADRFGAGRVIVFGGVMLALGTALVPFVHSEWPLIAVLGVISAFGAGAGSFSILIGSVLQRLPPEKRSFAAGFVNAGGSLGQFVFAPIVQAIISGLGWVTAMLAVAGASLITLPLAWPLRRRDGPHIATGPGAVPVTTLRAQLRIAAAEPSYWLLHLGFFTCGFHVACLVTYLPREVRLRGLPAPLSATALPIIRFGDTAGRLGPRPLRTRRRVHDSLL